MSETENPRVINGSTPLIKLSTKEYPRYYRNLKNDNTQTIFSSDTLPVDELEQYGYAIVNPVTAPVADVVTQGAPELREDGEWYQTWTTSEKDQTVEFNEGKRRLLKEADELIETELSMGIPFSKEVDGHTVSYHLQAGPRDRSNWVGIFQVAQLRKEAGDETVSSIRTYENTFVSLTPTELVDDLLFLLKNVDDVYRKYWVFKDAVLTLTVGDELPDLPLSFIDE